MGYQTKWSVQGLLYGLTAAAVIPASILLGVSVVTQYQADERAAALSASSLAQLVADNAQVVLSDTQLVLSKIAERPTIRNGSAGHCDPIFQQFKDLYPQFANLSQSNPQGYLICSAKGQPGNRLTYVGNADWFKQVYSTGKFTVGPPYLGPLTKRVVAVLAQPVVDDNGKITGSVNMPLDLAKFRVVRSAEKLPESTLVAIIDSGGVVVARSRNAEGNVGKNMKDLSAVRLVLAKKKGTGRATTSDGIERVLGFVPIPGTDWFAVAGIDTGAVLASAREAAVRSLVFGGLILLMILLLAVALSKRISRPMAAVQEAARRATAGDLSVRVPYAGPLEVADFAVQFNLMLDAIRSAQTDLANAQSELVLLGKCLSHLTDMVIIMNARETTASGWPLIVFVNQSFEDTTGYARSQVLGKPITLLHGPCTDAESIENMHSGFAEMAPLRQELLQYASGGEQFWGEIDMIPIRDPDGALTHWVAINRDVTARKQAQASIHRLAYFDALTELPNRPLLIDRIETALAKASTDGVLGAVLFVDLDHFKNINDARGHAVGDALLQVAARRLASVTRPEDTLARLGGDEFVIVATGLSSDEHLCARMGMALANKVCAAMAPPFDVEGQPYNATASIGVSLLRGGGQSAHDVLREADTAMYRAKKSGRNCAAFFEQEMQEEVEMRLALEHDLASAIKHGQMEVYVQTQVDVHGRAAGAELLLRWNHPNRGNITPALFIPIAEESGLILELGAWVLEQGCKALAALDDALGDFPVSVNVSARQFRHDAFVAEVSAVLAKTGAPASRLIFEVTESLLIDNLDDIIKKMGELARLGIRFSIDDFGTGYSSMAYLKRLPLHELKIDKSFIHDTPQEENDTAIVKLILSMARHLGLRVVAEGVETQEQADFLIANHCHSMQGYLFHRPVPMKQWLTDMLLSARENGRATTVSS